MKNQWRIFINYGTEKEFEKTEKQEFNTKSEAKKWCKENGYPYKCIVKQEEYETLKQETEKIVIMK